MKNKHLKRGFTLIELLVVVLIIGILAAVALPQYQQAVEKSRIVQLQVRLDGLYKAAEVYFMETGIWPNDVRVLDIDVTAGATEFKKSSITSADHIAAFYPDESLCEVHVSPAGNKTVVCRNKDVNMSIIEGKRACRGITDLGTKICSTLSNL